ncbi:uncharacterized protein ISCGN_001320 [Ixodes scapularis]
MVTCVNALAKEKLCLCGELLVKGKKCLVIDPNTRDLKMKLLWLPDHLENRRIVEALTPYGIVRSIHREKWRCPEMEHMDTLNSEVDITLHEGTATEKIPHLLQVYGIQTLVIIAGRPPLYLRCNRVGHIRRQCRTPRCFKCGTYRHIADACVTTYATKLRGKVSRDAEELSGLLMDISEVVDASGHTSSAKTFMTHISKKKKKKDFGIFLELTPAPCDPGDDDDASSTATIVEEDAPSDAKDTAAPAEVIPKASEKEAVAPRPEVATELGDQNDPVPVNDVPFVQVRKDRKPGRL